MLEKYSRWAYCFNVYNTNGYITLRHTGKVVSDLDFSNSLQMYWLLVLSTVLLSETFNPSSVSIKFTTRHSISYGTSRQRITAISILLSQTPENVSVDQYTNKYIILGQKWSIPIQLQNTKIWHFYIVRSMHYDILKLVTLTNSQFYNLYRVYTNEWCSFKS